MDAEKNRHEYGYTVICPMCENKFEALRYDATFCSSKCRTAHHRLTKRLDKNIAKLNAVLSDVIRSTPRQGDSKALRALLKIEHRIVSVISMIDGIEE